MLPIPSGFFARRCKENADARRFLSGESGKLDHEPRGTATGMTESLAFTRKVSNLRTGSKKAAPLG
jgi:hypothetical protein